MKRTTSATCPTCGVLHEHVPVERDEFGAYAVLEVKPCAEPACDKLLCGACDQFHCDGCGQTFCADHLVSVPDGTERPLHCCGPCALDCEPAELPPAPTPARIETRITVVVGRMEAA